MKISANIFQNYSKMTPQMLPKCSQMVPWDPLWTPYPKSDVNSRLLGAIWEPFWSPMGSLGAPKITQNVKHAQQNAPKIDTETKHAKYTKSGLPQTLWIELSLERELDSHISPKPPKSHKKCSQIAPFGHPGTPK